jgi:hypothetical protein
MVKRAKASASSEPPFSEHPNIADYDWRLTAVTTLAEPAGIHPAGTPIVAICEIEFDSKTLLRYSMPNVSALLLEYSHRAWQQSSDARSLFSVDGLNGHKEPADYSGLALLLERRMAAAVFAYTAIEAFATGSA